MESSRKKIQIKTSDEISGKQALLLIDLTKFYYDEKNIIKFRNIIEGKTKISLRLIDWFVTNYSKKENINYLINKIKNGKNITEQFIVHLRYKDQLKAYSKRQFDPFCRRERIQYKFNNGNNYLLTTVGQLNFFRWALENKVIDYIEEHCELIEQDMNKRNSTSKRNNIVSSGNASKTRKKREELSVSAVKSIKKEEVEIVVRFD